VAQAREMNDRREIEAAALMIETVSPARPIRDERHRRHRKNAKDHGYGEQQPDRGALETQRGKPNGKERLVNAEPGE
jgi:hypothetical protein